jgi:hypothetical protein
VARTIKSDDVLHCLTDLFLTHGVQENIHSDNGPRVYCQGGQKLAQSNRGQDPVH